MCEYYLVVTDDFPWIHASITSKKQKGENCSRSLLNDFMLRYRIPSKILPDQGNEFENDLLKELAKLSRVKKRSTTPYHPQTSRKLEK